MYVFIYSNDKVTSKCVREIYVGIKTQICCTQNWNKQCQIWDILLHKYV